MKQTVLIFICLFSLFIANAQNKNNYVNDQLIIKFKEDVNVDFKNCLFKQKFGNDVVDNLNKKYGVQKIVATGNKKKGDTYILNFKQKQDIQNLVSIYQKTGLFKYVEPNYIGKIHGQSKSLRATPNDTHFARQYGLFNDGTFSATLSVADADIDMELAWDIEQGDASIIVAVLDAGAKMNHPEFNNRIWQNTADLANGTDDDANGYIDDLQGWDFVNNDNDPADDHGHGTNVAGIIGANANNNTGYVGVDWNCKVMICKVLDNTGAGTYTWWADAIYYAVDNGANVINMSLGGASFSNMLEDAVNYAHTNNVTVVCSMGNDNNNAIVYPAGFANSIAVGSTDASDQRSVPFNWSVSSGSSYGNHIDVVAPGTHVYGLSHTSNTVYNIHWSGTSQATPLVVGVCALLLAQDPTKTPEDIRMILRNTAEDQVGNAIEDVAGFDNYYGYGRLNAHQALLSASLTSIKNDLDQTNLRVYPNPCNEYFQINNNITSGTIMLTNAVGQVVYENVNHNLGNAFISVKNLPKGLYLLNVRNNENQTIASQKIIVN